jgi:hypothetical protein
MSNSIPVEMFTKEIMDLLDETFENVHGMYLDKGTSLFETLATISAEEASQPVSPTCAALSAQVEHVRFYVDLLERSIRGEDAGRQDWGEIWRTVRDVTPEQWADSKSRLMESYKRLLETMKSLPFDNADQVGGVINVVTHTAYHLGEIRQALCILHQQPKTGVQHVYGVSKS